MSEQAETQPTREIVVALDESAVSTKSLDYIHLLFGNDPRLRPVLFHVQPSLSPMLMEESRMDRVAASQLKAMDERNRELADKVLQQARKALLDKGLKDEQIRPVSVRKKIGIARDICQFSEDRRADAIAISTLGKSRLEAFLLGETANKVLEASRVCPVWMIKGDISARNVLIAMDSSENAHRAVDHAGYMLAGIDVRVILFYACRHLHRYVPQSEIENAPELEKLIRDTEGKQMAPHLKRAREVLATAGVDEDRISVQIGEGSRNPASDILDAAKKNKCGTIVMGRRGLTGFQAYTMGSVSRKVLEASEDMAMWLVS